MFFWVLKRNSQLVPWEIPLFFFFALFLQFCATKLCECKAGQVFLDLLESTLHTSAFTMVFYEIVHKWGHTHHVIIMLISSGWNVCDLYLMTLAYFLCNMLSSFISEVSLSFVCVSGTLCNGICHCGNFEIPLGIKDREDTYYFTLVCVLKKSSTHRWEGGKSF